MIRLRLKASQNLISLVENKGTGENLPVGKRVNFEPWYSAHSLWNMLSFYSVFIPNIKWSVQKHTRYYVFYWSDFRGCIQNLFF